MSEQTVIDSTRKWLEEVVIGLNLCPFAAKPNRLNQIHYAVCSITSEDTDWETSLLQFIEHELQRLDNHSEREIETTLIVTPSVLLDFTDYNQFLDYAEFLIQRGGWEGTYQIASFHPSYCFADSHPDDAENLTNRSPYPIFHLIRESSLEEAIEKYPDTENIPAVNIERVESLSQSEKATLFPYLFHDHGSN